MSKHAGYKFRAEAAEPPPVWPDITDILIEDDSGTLLAFAIAANPNNRQFYVEGGTAPFTFEVVAGALLNGWELDADGAFRTLGDTPEEGSVTIRVTDAHAKTFSKTYSEIYSEE